MFKDVSPLDEFRIRIKAQVNSIMSRGDNILALGEMLSGYLRMSFQCLGMDPYKHPKQMSFELFHFLSLTVRTLLSGRCVETTGSVT